MSSADENSANAANIAELNAHIQLAGQKLKTLRPDSEAYKENVELLEDYYERIVQMKGMRNDTLEEIVRDNEARFRDTLYRWKIALLFICIVFMAIVGTIAPDAVVSTADALIPFMTIDRIITNILLVTVALYVLMRR